MNLKRRLFFFRLIARWLLRLPWVRKIIFKPFSCSRSCTIDLSVDFLGKKLSYPTGLAAGFDVTGELFPYTQGFGFSFHEVGPLQLRPQKPIQQEKLEVFPEKNAVFYRDSLENAGIERCLAHFSRLKELQQKIMVGMNISKSRTTPKEKRVENYQLLFNKLQIIADYFVIFIDQTQGIDFLTKLLDTLECESPLKPLLIKCRLENSPEFFQEIHLLSQKYPLLKGVVLSNALLTDAGMIFRSELSVVEREKLKRMRHYFSRDFSIVYSGGLQFVEDCIFLFQQGVNAHQILSTFLRKGPGFVYRWHAELSKALKKRGVAQLSNLRII